MLWLCVCIHAVSSDHYYLCAKTKFIAHSCTCSPFPLHPPLVQGAPGADVIISKRPQQEAHTLACQKNIFCLADLVAAALTPQHLLGHCTTSHPPSKAQVKACLSILETSTNYYNSRRSLLTTLHTDGVDRVQELIIALYFLFLLLLLILLLLLPTQLLADSRDDTLHCYILRDPWFGSEHRARAQVN